ncbi:MAG: hypothetical protein ACFCD0_14210 [Gemmataceae bacterium]
MNTITRLVLAGVAVLAASPLIFSVSATVGDAKIMKTVQTETDKVAEAVGTGKKKDTIVSLTKSTVKKITAADDEDYKWLNVMTLFSPRRRGGFGVGQKGEIEIDGIERKIRALTRGPLMAGQLKKESAALIQMGYRTSAIAKISHAMPMKQDKNKREATAKWLKYAKSMDKASMNFVKAVKAKAPKMVQKAATAIDNSCNQCHKDFRL